MLSLLKECVEHTARLSLPSASFYCGDWGLGRDAGDADCKTPSVPVASESAECGTGRNVLGEERSRSHASCLFSRRSDNAACGLLREGQSVSGGVML